MISLSIKREVIPKASDEKYDLEAHSEYLISAANTIIIFGKAAIFG
jgi:hypothetical protein